MEPSFEPTRVVGSCTNVCLLVPRAFFIALRQTDKIFGSHIFGSSGSLAPYDFFFSCARIFGMSLEGSPDGKSDIECSNGTSDMSGIDPDLSNGGG